MTIMRQQVYREIMSGRPFDAEWVTCDRKRGTGGKLIRVSGWTVSPHTTTGSSAKGDSSDKSAENSKAPSHAEHGTLNLVNPANSGVHVHKVHLDLITFFNGKRVIN